MIIVQATMRKKRALPSKITTAKRAGGMVYIGEHLPCKRKDLSSNNCTAKKIIQVCKCQLHGNAHEIISG
jgi:hypothetical protein